MKIYNDIPRSKAQPLGAQFAFRNADKVNEPLTLLVYEQIGKDPWTGEGVSAKEVKEQLLAADNSRELHVRVNSRGGYVVEGLGIYHAIKAWKGNTIGFVDGVASSIASALLMACKEVRMPKASEMLIHDAWADVFLSGNAEEIERQSDEACAQLESASDMIAGIYAEKIGKAKDIVRDLMKKVTKMRGEEAVAMKFADTLIDGEPLYNFSPEDISAVRNLTSPRQKPGGKQPLTKENRMDLTKILAMLRNAGQTVDDKATDEQLLDLLNKLVAQKPGTQKVETPKAADAPNADATVIELQAALKEMTAQRNADRKERITRAVHALVLEDRIPANAADKWVLAAMANEDILNSLRELPARPPGAAPLTVLETNADVKTVLNRFAELGKDNTQAVAKAQLFNAHEDRIIGRLMNAAGDNTIAAGLQRQVILQQAVKAFSIPLLPTRAFASVFENVPLEGTDIVNVPFYDRETAASTDWNAANGYVIGETTTDTRAVTINKRKYQALSISSSLLRRQPFYKTQELINVKAEKLAADVFADILSVVTLANYGDLATTTLTGFDFNDLIDIGIVCSQLYWPVVGRTLVLDSAIYGSLAKEFKDASAAGDTNSVNDGRVIRKGGFDIYDSPYIPANTLGGTTLKGMAVIPSAILVATAPIMPSDEVRSDLLAYEVFVNPATGMAIEYRSYGNAQADVGAHTIECNYGYAKGNANALRRVVIAA